MKVVLNGPQAPQEQIEVGDFFQNLETGADFYTVQKIDDGLYSLSNLNGNTRWSRYKSLTELRESTQSEMLKNKLKHYPASRFNLVLKEVAE